MPNILNRWHALWHPNEYHGWGRSRRYFEGWYFKLVDPTEQYALAVIPGISMDEHGTQQAFVQLLDGKQCRTAFYDFAGHEFQPSPRRFEVAVGPNRFSGEGLSLHLPDLSGQLTFQNLHPWPKMLGAPGIMGWYSFVPFMQCYHGVVSVHHRLQGELQVNGQAVDFSGGIGYMEKDWGTSFPSSWIWMQSNHFDTPEPCSVMVSVARIPWLGSHFVGFIAGFLWQGKIYRLATYTGAKLQVQLAHQQATIVLQDKRYRLEVIGRQGAGGELISPISGRMTGKVNESLQSTLEVAFYEQGRLLFSGTGRNAGLELAGDIQGELAGDK